MIDALYTTAVWLVVAAAVAAACSRRFWERRDRSEHLTSAWPDRTDDGFYELECTCGTTVAGTSEQACWAAFDRHLFEVASGVLA